MVTSIRQLPASLVAGVLVAPIHAEARAGGMTAQQAFPDPATAAWVSAVWDKDYKEADRWLAQGAKVNLVGTDGITPLLWVMSAGKWKVDRLEYMLKAGADPNQKSPKENVSPMFGAAKSDKPEVLTLFLRYHGDPNLTGEAPDEEPILFAAVSGARMENIKLLLEAGADVNALDRLGVPAPFNALFHGRYDIVEFFLQHGLKAGLGALATACDSTPVSPDRAVWREKVICEFVDRGIFFPRSLVVRSDPPPTKRDHELQRELGEAERAGDRQRVISLLEESAGRKHVRSMLALASLYHQGFKNDPASRDYVKARYWYLQAMKADHGDAWNNLGILYRDGLGVPSDPQLAWACFTIAQVKEDSGTTGMRAKHAQQQLIAVLPPAKIAEASAWTVDYVRIRLEGQEGASPDLAAFKSGPDNPSLKDLKPRL